MTKIVLLNFSDLRVPVPLKVAGLPFVSYLSIFAQLLKFKFYEMLSKIFVLAKDSSEDIFPIDLGLLKLEMVRNPFFLFPTFFLDFSRSLQFQ